MRISKVELKNFKRFTELKIEYIPHNAKLVLVIGSNGSGKSCVFDAFDWLNKGPFKGLPYSGEQALNYYRKEKKLPAEVTIQLSSGENIHKIDWNLDKNAEMVKRFIGRSSIRIVSRITNSANPDSVKNDQDSPVTFIENDQRFTNDVFLYIQSINKALREPVFSGKQADTLKIFQEFIEPFNSSLLNIFGSNPQTTIRIAEFEDATPQAPAKLIFQKGDSKINYDFLSHGEKQVVILLLNFIVRQSYYQDSIIFIDEMDVHMNTKLQFKVIKEITERWIPANSQLWTATHALGFIEYANSYGEGIVLDFDDLDFDKTQVLKPADKNDYQIFELAVSKEFIDKAFQGRRIIFAEQTDAPLYNDLSFKDIFFFDGKDKLGAFQKAKNLNQNAIVDRDYLSDEDVAAIKNTYPFISILPYYSIENLLYHPDNLEEYYLANEKPFDKTNYVNAITLEKNNERDYIVAGIMKARDGYPFFKENGQDKLLKAFKENYAPIIEMLKSDDFETFYKIFPAKDYGTTLNERQNLNRKDLAKTKWFKLKIQEAINA
jgi:AAA15 family ATPase/GTPase